MRHNKYFFRLILSAVIISMINAEDLSSQNKITLSNAELKAEFSRGGLTSIISTHDDYEANVIAGAFGRPISGGTGAVFLTAENYQRRLLLLVFKRCIIDEHFAAFGLFDGIAAFLITHHPVFNPDIAESSAHHDIMVAPAGAVRIEILRGNFLGD